MINWYYNFNYEEASMNVNLIKSPLFNNWFESIKIKKSIIICSPFLKKTALEKLINFYNLYNKDIACNIEVIIRGKLSDFFYGASDISALELLIKIPNLEINNVRRLTNLHMKAYLMDEKNLLIGSGNCTERGLFAQNYQGNVEIAIATDNPEVVDNFKEYYYDIISVSQSLNNFYDEIVKGYDDCIAEVPAKEDPKAIRDVESKESKTRFKFKKQDISITSDLIPQFSSFDHGAYDVLKILWEDGDSGMTFLELGKKLEGPGKEKGAYLKYGENHAKLAELLDFVVIDNSRARQVFLTKLGKSFYNSDIRKQEEYIKRQIIRMDVIRDILNQKSQKAFNIEEYLRQFLSKTTAHRRAPNVRTLLKKIK